MRRAHSRALRTHEYCTLRTSLYVFLHPSEPSCTLKFTGDVQLAHLPAGRFLYGHDFLKPFEFTSMWSTATGRLQTTSSKP